MSCPNITMLTVSRDNRDIIVMMELIGTVRNGRKGCPIQLRQNITALIQQKERYTYIVTQ